LPSRDVEIHLQDILTSIDAIEQFVVDMDIHLYHADLKTRSAVERQLQITTEAAFRLGEQAAKLCPTVDWRGVRGLGNVLRHEYDEIDDEEIWAAIHEKLPHLKAAAQNALAKLWLSPPEESR
jgi:uncharacterized protein with HEPN domain